MVDMERIDLAELARMIQRHIPQGEPPVGYLRGRSYFRDVIAHALHCSDYEAEELVDIAALDTAISSRLDRPGSTLVGAGITTPVRILVACAPGCLPTAGHPTPALTLYREYTPGNGLRRVGITPAFSGVGPAGGAGDLGHLGQSSGRVQGKSSQVG